MSRLLCQIIAGVAQLQAELEALVGLDHFVELLKGDKDAIHHNATVCHPSSQNIVRGG